MERRRERIEELKRRDAWFQNLYPVPKHWMSEEERRQHYHLDLAEMDIDRLELEKYCLMRRIDAQRIRRSPFGGVDGIGPHCDWLRERLDRINAALRGEMPPHAGCPTCGKPPRPPYQPHQPPTKPAGRVELHFTNGRAK